MQLLIIFMEIIHKLKYALNIKFVITPYVDFEV